MTDRQPHRRHTIDRAGLTPSRNATPDRHRLASPIRPVDSYQQSNRSVSGKSAKTLASQVARPKIAGEVKPERSYVHLRDKLDFNEEVRYSFLTSTFGRGDGEFKYKYNLPLEAKAEASLVIKRGKKKAEATQDMPLKNDFNKDLGPQRRLRRKVDIYHQPSARIERGKRTFPTIHNVDRSKSETITPKRMTIPKETTTYMQLQKEKRSLYDKNVDLDCSYRSKTPERFNSHVMSSTMHYDYAKFPVDKLTEKITKLPASSSKSFWLDQRRSKSYYGRHGREF